MLRTFGTMALLVVAAAAYLSYKRLHDGGGGGGEGTPGVPLDVPRPPNQTTLPEPIGFDWIPAIVVLSIAVVGAAAGAVLLWHTQRRRPSAARAAAALAAALDESLEDLRSERNARRAVIAAYARMERALGAAGFPRRTAEAPLEYLSRVLRDLVRASAGSVARLTALFERAKFSRHEIGPELKEEAIEALVAVREELRAVS